MAVDVGDALLHTLTARREMPWEAFRDAFDSVYRPAPGADPEPVRYARSRLARILTSLGHCEITPGRLVIAPPVLALLPSPGLPTAVLCGARSPETASTVAACCDGRRLLASAAPTPASAAPAPSSIAVTAYNVADHAELACHVGLHFSPTPTAWLLAEAACTIEEYVQSLGWTSDPEINWNRRDFDPEQLHFAAPGATQTAAARLSRYEHPGRHGYTDQLWIGGRSAAVDRSWGRYVALAAAGVHAIEYNQSLRTVAVPATVPLPSLASRALALCSGQAPHRGGRTGDHGSARPGGAFDIYPRVPPDIFDVIATKLGQARSGSGRREVAWRIPPGRSTGYPRASSRT